MSQEAALLRGTKVLLQERRETLSKIAELEQRLAFFEKRARAEEILLEARSGRSENLRTSTIPEFMDKRAQLERQDDLDKIAEVVKYLSDHNDVELSDVDDTNTRHSTFDQWVADRLNGDF